MQKITSVHMQPCRLESAERHNSREAELDYVRKDLSHLNVSEVWIPISSQMKKIREEYKKATKQRFQPSSRPIQEIVMVIEDKTTPQQIEAFCELIKELGMTPLSYAIHRDEGHEDALTGQWIPNNHAHIIVDTTCWQHKNVKRMKKKNGKNVLDPETGKPVHVTVDGYAKTTKFTRSDMVKLQDYAAQATGMQRGVSSSREAETARRYKAKQQAKQIQEQSKLIETQQEMIVKNDEILKSCVLELQEKGTEVLELFDEQVERARKANYTVAYDLLVSRKAMSILTKENITELPSNEVAGKIRPLLDGILKLTSSLATVSSVVSSGLTECIKKRDKQLSELSRQAQRLSLGVSLKGAVLALLDKPANKQVKELQDELKTLRTEADSLREKAGKADEYELFTKQLKESVSLSEEEFAELQKKNRSLLNDLTAAYEKIQKLNKIKEDYSAHLTKVVRRIVGALSGEQIQRLESLEIKAIVGPKRWEEAKSMKEQQSQANQTGMQVPFPVKGIKH